MTPATDMRNPLVRQRIHVDDLEPAVRQIFEHIGFAKSDATRASNVLVTADLRGVETHGVSNMLRKYVAWAERGQMDPRAEPTLDRDALSTASYDSNKGLGIVHLPKLMDIALEKASMTGAGFISVRNGRHSGMIAYHAMLALPHDMIGFCCTAGTARVVPTFGREPRLGTNPIAIAVPTQTDPPWVFDASTSAVAHNKFTIARRLGEPIGAGWHAGPEGSPIMEPTHLEEEAEDLMLPLGSTPELGSHKGYALSSLVDILASILSAGSFSAALQPGASRHFIGALDVASFTDPVEFKREMTHFCEVMRSTPPAAGHDRVLVPNDREWEREQDYRKNGIPLHPEVVGWLSKTCVEMGITPPAPMAGA